MRVALGFDLADRSRLLSWTEALRRMIEQADEAGILVMVSGVVGSDNHRKLDPEEFRGFALADKLAPLVFINGADTKAAQMFTLAQELAHIWLGETALSSADLEQGQEEHDVERFCDHVAAELLVPLEVLMAAFDESAELLAELHRHARHFKVSILVILRRLRDAGALDAELYWSTYERLSQKAEKGGGDFYLTLGARGSRRFARAVVVSALEGRLPFTEAFRLLGLRKMSTFDELERRLGVSV